MPGSAQRVNTTCSSQTCLDDCDFKLRCNVRRNLNATQLESAVIKALFMKRRCRRQALDTSSPPKTASIRAKSMPASPHSTTSAELLDSDSVPTKPSPLASPSRTTGSVSSRRTGSRHSRAFHVSAKPVMTTGVFGNMKSRQNDSYESLSARGTWAGEVSLQYFHRAGAGAVRAHARERDGPWEAPRAAPAHPPVRSLALGTPAARAPVPHCAAPQGTAAPIRPDGAEGAAQSAAERTRQPHTTGPATSPSDGTHPPTARLCKPRVAAPSPRAASEAAEMAQPRMRWRTQLWQPGSPPRPDAGAILRRPAVCGFYSRGTADPAGSLLDAA